MLRYFDYLSHGLAAPTPSLRPKRATAHYGIVVSGPYDASKDLQDDYYQDPVSGEMIAVGQIMWFIQMVTYLPTALVSHSLSPCTDT